MSPPLLAPKGSPHADGLLLGRAGASSLGVARRTCNGIAHEDGTTLLVVGNAGAEVLSDAAAQRLARPTWRALLSARPGAEEPLMIHSSVGRNPYVREFEDEMRQHTPPQLSACSLVLQAEGCSAVQAAVQALCPANRFVAVCAKSYHGPPAFAFGHGHSASDASFSPPQLCYPDPREGADVVLQWVEEHASTLGVLIVEPQRGSAGLGEPWRRAELVRVLGRARALGVRVVCDEIMCGMGRHGQGPHAFLTESWSLPADAVVFGKGVGLAGPLAGALLRRDAVLRHPANHTYAHGAHTIALRLGAALLRELSIYLRDRSQTLSAVMGEELTPLRDTMDVRGQGLLWGIAAADGAAVARACRDAGVIVYAVPRGILLTPPLDMQPDVLRHALRVIAAVVRGRAHDAQSADADAPPALACAERLAS